MQSRVLKIDARDINTFLRCPRKFMYEYPSYKPTKKKTPEIFSSLVDYNKELHAQIMKSVYGRAVAFEELPAISDLTKRVTQMCIAMSRQFPELQDENLRTYINDTIAKITKVFLSFRKQYNRGVFIPIAFDYTHTVRFNYVDVICHADMLFYSETENGMRQRVYPAFFDFETPIRSYNILLTISRLRDELGLECDRVLYYNKNTLSWSPIRIPYSNKEIFEFLEPALLLLGGREFHSVESELCDDCKLRHDLMCRRSVYGKGKNR